MAWGEFEWVYVEAEFLELGGGELWTRVEAVAWQRRENERAGVRRKQADYRSRQPERLAHCSYERTRRVRNKSIDESVRCCGVCRQMFVQTKQQALDGTKFCSTTCAAKYRYRQLGRPIRTGHLVSMGGKVRSVRDWAMRNGLSPRTVYKRIRDGMTPEQALTAPLKPQRERAHHRLVTIDGEERRLDDWAQHFGVSKSIVYRRVKRGMTMEEALRRGGQR